MKTYRGVTLAAAVSAMSLSAVNVAWAQDKYPVDTVTMVVPYAAGGAGDNGNFLHGLLFPPGVVGPFAEQRKPL